ncbi:Crp/Fnr family transcriptional regulator [Pontibacter sp. G13]|uniref:Crp/Fnr family transcriptional regulator n=1 Tax=Pontibacter sp. G13 TaxID=3074898 RepID=UPI00288BD400|nr:Crp/Fnr family transcriptional regulator [Pontibacter sp. G13]WNJ20029.1 Crp/Fnr family transcriptional regulator [Pontibacter sp. G13]
MSTFDAISRFFETEYPLNQAGLAELFGAFSIQRLPKGTLLLTGDEPDQYLRFLNRGIVREFYSTGDRESNLTFYLEPQFISDFSAFMHQRDTHKFQESLTEVEQLSIGRTQFFELLERYQCGKAFIHQTFAELLAKQEDRAYERMTKKPEELYQILLEKRPNWLREIPQYHIASYLNITPETLSRLRKRIS